MYFNYVQTVRPSAKHFPKGPFYVGSLILFKYWIAFIRSIKTVIPGATIRMIHALLFH